MPCPSSTAPGRYHLDVDPSPDPPPTARWLVPAALTLVVGALLAATHRLGGDMPGIHLRIEALRQGDFIRLPQWFGGAPNLTYSVLLAPLGVVLGVPLLAGLSAGSTVAGVCWLGRHVESRRRTVLLTGAAVASALATLAVGRVTYSTGTAFGVWSVALLLPLAHEPRRLTRLTGAVVLALLAGAASPVAGMFLGMIAVGHLVPARRLLNGAAVAGAALASPVVVNLAFASDGGLALSAGAGLTISALYLAVAATSRSRSVRATAFLGVIATAAVTVVDTQVTYIVKRLPETFGAPALAATGRRFVSTAVVCVLLGWNLLSLRTGLSESGQGERSGAAFAPLVATLRDLGVDGTVEVVPTALHWETWYVAREFPIARGWERQSDADHGALFYDGSPIDAAEYAEWLRAEDVAYVALPRLEIDHAGRAEADLLADPPEYLRILSDDGLWTVWAVELP